MPTPKPVRALAAAALSLGLAVGATSCGAPQTLQRYTPAEGVNVDASATDGVPLKVRNLLLMTKEKGRATLVGSVISPKADELEQVAGQLLSSNGDPGGRLGPAQTKIAIKANEPVNFLSGPAIQLDASDLRPGQTADLVLEFREAGQVTVRVPVVDGNKADYKTVSPSAAPGQSGTPTPSAAPS